MDGHIVKENAETWLGKEAAGGKGEEERIKLFVSVFLRVCISEFPSCFLLQDLMGFP